MPYKKPVLSIPQILNKYLDAYGTQWGCGNGGDQVLAFKRSQYIGGGGQISRQGQDSLPLL